mgnify:CR=1 FL=1
MTTHRHFILHKPFGYLSQLVNHQNKRRNKKLLGELYDFPEGTMAIGRLDEGSEGLLLLTTDGKVSEEIRSNKIEKEYWAKVDGQIDEEALEQLRSGIELNIEGKLYTTQPCEARLFTNAPEVPISAKKIRNERHGPTSWVSITIREGKYRQVRKMTAAVGYPTLRLIRVRIGKITLGQLPAGECIEVDQFTP